jgi:DNA-binding CsgD family transcriptional regulator
MGLGLAQMMRGDVIAAAAQFGEVAVEAAAAHDQIFRVDSLAYQGIALAFQGDAGAARKVTEASIEAAAELGGIKAGTGYLTLAIAALAAGDAATTIDTTESAPYLIALSQLSGQRAISVEVALAGGDVIAARRRADDVVAMSTGFWRMYALTARARVAIAHGERDQAERDAHDALAIAAEVEAKQLVPDILECLGTAAGQEDSHREAVRLFATAQSIRQRMGTVRFKVWDASYEASVAALRDALGENDFDAAWAEGAALSTDEAIAYAQRGRGQRKRPASGWASLTPAERDVVRLVTEGLANKDIATRLFVSPRTVQTHLTHVYTKLGLTSRVQLAQESARHS